MSIKIEEKIIDFDIVAQATPATVSPSTPTPSTEPPDRIGSDKVVQMHEKLKRPEMLIGSTYKISPPVSEHAFYITINDIILNPATPYEKRRPFEIFINSKNMDHYQWISALTLIISAVFRKGGDVTFLVKELQSVFDPKGGYFRKGGKFRPSVVAEIGDTIESHLKTIGLIFSPEMEKHQQALLKQKREEFEKQQILQSDSADSESNSFPEGAQLCHKCHYTAMIVMDNCLTCLNCGESKCG